MSIELKEVEQEVLGTFTVYRVIFKILLIINPTDDIKKEVVLRQVFLDCFLVS